MFEHLHWLCGFNMEQHKMRKSPKTPPCDVDRAMAWTNTATITIYNGFRLNLTVTAAVVVVQNWIRFWLNTHFKLFTRVTNKSTYYTPMNVMRMCVWNMPNNFRKACQTFVSMTFRPIEVKINRLQTLIVLCAYESTMNISENFVGELKM